MCWDIRNEKKKKEQKGKEKKLTFRLVEGETKSNQYISTFKVNMCCHGFSLAWLCDDDDDGEEEWI